MHGGKGVYNILFHSTIIFVVYYEMVRELAVP